MGCPFGKNAQVDSCRQLTHMWLSKEKEIWIWAQKMPGAMAETQPRCLALPHCDGGNEHLFIRGGKNLRY